MQFNELIHQKLVSLASKIIGFTKDMQIASNEQYSSLGKNEQLSLTLVDKMFEEYTDLNTTRENYLALEKQVQKYENEIRKHIRMEQQIKLYAESLQQKCDESEATRSDMLQTTKSMINNVKRENQNLSDQNKLLKQENDQFKISMKGLKDQERVSEDKQKLVNLCQERIKVLEGLGNNTNIPKVQRQTSSKKVNMQPDLKFQSEKSSVSQTIDNSLIGNKRNDYFKVKIEIENSKESQKIKQSNLRYHHSSERPQSTSMDKKSQSVQKKSNIKQYTSGTSNKPYISNPTSIHNSIHIVSNYQSLVKSRHEEARQPASMAYAKKIIGNRQHINKSSNYDKSSQKAPQDYTQFLDHEFNNY